MAKDKKRKKRGEDEGPNTNVPAGAYGGAEDYGGGAEYGGQMFPPEMWDYLKSREQISDTLRTQAQLANPEKYARDQYMAQTYAAPFAPGGLFEGRGAAAMAPEAVMASQGNTAANQWAQLGANKNIDPATLAKYNQGAGGPRTGSVGQPISPEEMAEFERQAALNTPKTYI